MGAREPPQRAQIPLEVDDRTVGAGHRGPVTKQLQDDFFAATSGQDPRYASWLTYVND